MKWVGLFIVVLVIFSVGVGVGMQSAGKQLGNAQKDIDEQTDKYPYLARRIFFDDPKDTILNFTNLRSYLRTFVDSAPNFIGIYFEYLPTGTTIGVNDREVLFAASLIKIPMAMEIMKQIELDNLSLDEELTIEEEHIDTGFGDLWQKGVGTRITVKEAIKYSLVYSDNTAYRLLLDEISDKDLTEVFNYLDIPLDIEGPGGGITAKNFSSVLRSLYFSAYLSYEDSNELLNIMSMRSEYDILAREVPEDVKIANKIGVYNAGSREGHVYSDCGIFYLAKRPYTLCVMIRGASSRIVAETQISDISKVVYNYVSDVNIEKASKK